MSEYHLSEEFSSISAKQWKQKIQVDLKGADYNETLVWESPEGIKVKPFYHAEDLENIPVYPTKARDWKIAQPIYAANPYGANTKAKSIVQKGVESLLFAIPNATCDFNTLLSGIDLEKIPIHFDYKHLDTKLLESLHQLVKDKKAQVFLNLDLIGQLARTGNWFHSQKEDHVILREIVSVFSNSKSISSIGIDTTLYQNAGANMVQQLAYGLAHAHEYLHEFQSDMPLPTFKVSVGGNYFFEIAKIKALRLLWCSLAKEYGIYTECHVIATPSRRNKTLYDYNVNMLRTTSECMSAILGGANTVCNLSYDAIYHKDNDFAERIARNQLILLKEESYFKVASQATEGAYYIESLTHQLAEKALVLFKQIEASGGFLSSLFKGKIQQKIADSAAKEQANFDEGKTVLVGTNKYQNDKDQMKNDLELYPFAKKRNEKTVIVPIIERRWAEALEQKRLDNE